MAKFHFKLIDTNIVSDHGVHDLADETAAQIEAIKLARSLRATRPELAGRNCSVSVVDENGKGVLPYPCRRYLTPRMIFHSLQIAITSCRRSALLRIVQG